mgnify:CR=1 FL=1
MLKGKQTDHAEDGLGVAHRTRLGKAATGPPVTAAGYDSGEAFAATQKRKKVVTRSLLLAFVLLFKDESFFYFYGGRENEAPVKTTGKSKLSL